MTKDEMDAVVAEKLARFRQWSYDQLAERVERDRAAHDCLEYVEGVASDGTAYAIELNAMWDGKRGGDVRVCGFLSTIPLRPLFGFLPIYTSDAGDCFIMSPEGRLIDEE
ncbi:MAG: hypothetical protein DWQ34_03275 [Planctomycetota bacterium]|nr:MAG: hypothetical protein DWQ34_03275 [Planctomycetota bacterium]REK25589.1 MAG: hypothetical protein DWQ41_11680 [Planctomycetota bacterium]REK31700.1 MAG: hypothetical protein DWQ45_19005 [Planctomycetota bacterium]